VDVYGLALAEVHEDAAPILSRIHSADSPMVSAKIEESRRTGGLFRAEFRYLHPTRGEVWVEACSSPTTDEDGGVTWYGFVTDITERKNNEAALVASEERFQKLFELAPAGITLGVDRHVIEANAAFLRMMGATRAEMIGRSYASIGTPNPRLRDERLEAIEQAGSVSDLEVTFHRQDGTLGQGLLSAATIEMGGRLHTMMVTLDVTARKEIEARLRASDTLNRAVLHNIPGGYITVVGPDLRFLLAEGALLRELALPSVLIGKSVADVADEATARSAIEGYKRALGGETFEREVTYMGRVLRSQHVPLRNEDGTIYAALNLAVDVTHLRRTERELLRLTNELEHRVEARTAELAATNRELEAFTYSVSHDLRAPLRAIDGFALALQEDFAPLLPPEAQRHIAFLRSGAQQMAKLIDELLALSRVTRVGLTMDTVDMNAAVERTVNELRPMFADRKIELKIDPLPLCHGDSGLLRLVWQNLLGNALKYTSKNQVAHISIGAREPDSAENPGVTYTVSDDGAGFDMRYHHKLFGVFQRLHRPDEFEGTGVGLAIAHRIVHRHGGQITGQGEPGKGATFTFFIPSARGPA
jgi:hypothetical protein